MHDSSLFEAHSHDEARSALLVVAAALVDARGHILVQQRPASRDHGGLWEFPGGKLESGEGPIGALIRELAEELAITVAPDACRPLGFASSAEHGGTRPVVLLLYGCREWQGDPVSQEGAAIAWVDPAALGRLDMPPLDIPLIAPAIAFAAPGAS